MQCPLHCLFLSCSQPFPHLCFLLGFCMSFITRLSEHLTACRSLTMALSVRRLTLSFFPKRRWGDICILVLHQLSWVGWASPVLQAVPMVGAVVPSTGFLPSQCLLPLGAETGRNTEAGLCGSSPAGVCCHSLMLRAPRVLGGFPQVNQQVCGRGTKKPRWATASSLGRAWLFLLRVQPLLPQKGGSLTKVLLSRLWSHSRGVGDTFSKAFQLLCLGAWSLLGTTASPLDPGGARAFG